MNNKTTLIVTSLLSLTSLVGCGNSTTDGALLGAGIGALAGQAIGGNTEGTLIGAGAGALCGWIIGSEVEKDQMRNRRTREMLELERGVTLRRSETRKVLNRDGTYTTVGEETTVSEREESGYTGLPNN